MQAAATRLADNSTQQMRNAHTLRASGERRARVPFEEPALDDLCEPALDQVHEAAWASDDADTEQLHAAWDLVNEGELKIASLSSRVHSLEQLNNELIEALRLREAELAEFRERSCSSPVLSSGGAVPSRVGEIPVTAALLAGTPKPEASLPKRSLQLKRVSIVGWCDDDDDLRPEFDDDSHFFSGITRDVARGGFFVATYRNLNLGSFVELEFATLTGETLLVSGVVAWLRAAGSHQAERPGLGIAFTGLSSAARTIIEACWRVRPPLYVEF
jgi:Tfp pilus assembly protein PilZ